MGIRRPGQILLELVLAIGVVTVVIVALAGVATMSVFNTGFARRQSQASTYAQAGIEWVRSERDRIGWDEFFPFYNGIYCLATLDPTVWGSVKTSSDLCVTPIANTNFIRYIVVTNDLAQKNKKIEVTVKWTEGDRNFDVVQTTVLEGF